MSMNDRDYEREGLPPVESAPQSGDGMKSMYKELFDWAKTLAVALVVVIFMNMFVFNLSTVDGHSMEPTLQDGEWLFVNKFAYLIHTPQLGDVVILKSPVADESEKKFLVKRVVGLPGDRIEISNHQLYRNGEPVEEPYTDIAIEDADYGPIVVDYGHYFVMGDNRHARASMDSREFDAVPDEMIEGRADYILWPFAEFGSLK